MYNHQVQTKKKQVTYRFDKATSIDIQRASISNAMPALLELPWVPYYTQSGGGDGSHDADGKLSPLAYWSVAATAVFTITVYAFEGLLDARQKKAYRQTQFPKQLEVTVAKIDADKESEASSEKDENKDKEKDENEDEDRTDDDEKAGAEKKVDASKPLLGQLREKFEKSQAYGLDKINFSMIASAYDTFESIAFLMLGVLPYLWDKATNIGATYFQWTPDDEIKISLVFLFMITIIGTITSLPFELYSTFQIERKHGFNKQTYSLFFTDKVKSLLLTCVIGGPFIALLLKIIKFGGDYLVVTLWAFMFVTSLLMMTIIPVFIMPLFNKYEPLEDGPLKTQIYELAERLNYPLKKLFVMDGSTRSSHSNAFMFGFGKNKRIVLFDTLMEQVYDSEILAILGHELGHWKLGHTLTNFCVTQAYFGAAFYFFSLCLSSRDLYAAFGFDDPLRPPPTVITLMLFFQTLWAPVDKILSFILTVHSRRCEFDADKFSVDLGMSRKLQSGLCKIHLNNLGGLCPDPWYSTYHYSHPPLVERLSAMMALDKKSE